MTQNSTLKRKTHQIAVPVKPVIEPVAKSALVTESNTGAAALGPRLKQFRLGKGWTLEHTAQLTGVARSTLSKIEKGTMSPTFDVLQKIAHGMRLDIAEFFGAGAQTPPSGRRSITRRGQGRPLDSNMYLHEALSTELTNKRILPFYTTIKTRTLAEFGPLMKHSGEVFLFVISGKVRVHTELYEDAVLDVGDSIYFDSGLAHALIAESGDDAKVIWVCSEWIEEHN